MLVVVDGGAPLLSEALATALNPMSVTLVRIDGLPHAYSGTPFMAPYTELAERCLPVTAKWSLLGTEHVCDERPHARTLEWGERRLLLAGSDVIPPAQMLERLRTEGITLELHDRDPKPPPPPPAPPPAALPSDDERCDDEARARPKEAISMPEIAPSAPMLTPSLEMMLASLLSAPRPSASALPPERGPRR